MKTEDDVRAIWRSADCVCFDVDSTVCVDESIDELAAFLGVGDKVAELTRNAMQGSLTYKESLAARLKLMNPARQQVTQFITKNPPRLTEGIRELVDTLHERKVPVYLVTGGFRSIIELVAEELHIPYDRIFANRLLFYYNGEYAGFDDSQLTCQTGGKPRVIQQLKDDHHYQRVVIIGDGATDMEACPPASAFIGFGGNQVRQKVKDGSSWFVKSFQELCDELKRKSVRLE